MARKVNVEEMPMEALAKMIRKISATIEGWKKGSVKKDTIVLLIAEDTKISRRSVAAVLDSMENLEARYLKTRASLKNEKKHKATREDDADMGGW